MYSLRVTRKCYNEPGDLIYEMYGASLPLSFNHITEHVSAKDSSKLYISEKESVYAMRH